MTATEPTTAKYWLVDPTTGEQVKELPNAPSVLMLKELMKHCEAVDFAQQSYFEARRSKNAQPEMYLNQLTASQKTWRDYMKKVRTFLPQLN